MNSFSSGSSLSSQWLRQRRISVLSLSSNDSSCSNWSSTTGSGRYSDSIISTNRRNATGMRKYNNDERGTQKCTTIRSEIRVRDRLGPYNSDENINGSMNGNNRRYFYEKPNSCSVPFISPASSFSVPGRYSGRGGGGSRERQYQYQWQEQDKSGSINNNHDDKEEDPWGHFVDLCWYNNVTTTINWNELMYDNVCNISFLRHPINFKCNYLINNFPYSIITVDIFIYDCYISFILQCI
ncbi:MAG: hypothetical protein ACI8RD_002711 [Bacillariaceae sp.]|jgi:hypothetical protein